MHSYLCNTSWSAQRLLLLGMRSNSKWYYIRSGVIEIQRQLVGLWICIQKEVYRWFTKCYEPLKVWFLRCKKPMRPYFFCIIPWQYQLFSEIITTLYLLLISVLFFSIFYKSSTRIFVIELASSNTLAVGDKIIFLQPKPRLSLHFPINLPNVHHYYRLILYRPLH